MSTGPLPRQAEVRKLVTSGAVFEGTVKVAELPRLVQALEADEGLISYCLHFGASEEGIPCITGQVSGGVQVQCQRCLDAMPLDIESEFALGIVYSDEQAKHLPGALEPLVLEQDTVDTRTVLEDEVLLCLPIVSYHSQEDCARQAGYQSLPPGGEPEPEERRNPFEALAALKKPES